MKGPYHALLLVPMQPCCILHKNKHMPAILDCIQENFTNKNRADDLVENQLQPPFGLGDSLPGARTQQYKQQNRMQVYL